MAFLEFCRDIITSKQEEEEEDKNEENNNKKHKTTWIHHPICKPFAGDTFVFYNCLVNAKTNEPVCINDETETRSFLLFSSFFSIPHFLDIENDYIKLKDKSTPLKPGEVERFVKCSNAIDGKIKTSDVILVDKYTSALFDGFEILVQNVPFPNKIDKSINLAIIFYDRNITDKKEKEDQFTKWTNVMQKVHEKYRNSALKIANEVLTDMDKKKKRIFGGKITSGTPSILEEKFKKMSIDEVNEMMMTTTTTTKKKKDDDNDPSKSESQKNQ